MKTGGLADVVGALSSTQADSGHEVSVIIPGYRLAMSHPDALQSERRLRLKIEMGEKFISGDVRVFSPKRNLSIYLICRDEFLIVGTLTVTVNVTMRITRSVLSFLLRVL